MIQYQLKRGLFAPFLILIRSLEYFIGYYDFLIIFKGFRFANIL